MNTKKESDKKIITSFMMKDMTRKLVNVLVKYQELQKHWTPKKIEDLINSVDGKKTYGDIIKKIIKCNSLNDSDEFHICYRNNSRRGRATKEESEELRKYMINIIK